MGIKVDMGKAMAAIDNLGVKVQQAAPDFLAAVGERFCDEARATKTYTDRTKRLSASIGYGVVAGGRLVRMGGFGSGEGAVEGKATLQNAASEVDGDKPTLIVVVGMHYAIYVERKGFSILDGARLNLGNIADEAATSTLLKMMS